MKIAYLGPAGSHSHEAAELFSVRFIQPMLDKAPFLLPLMTLTQILETVDEGAVELACIPVENVLEGSVGEVLDGLALRFQNTQIIAEYVRPIQHALIRRLDVMEGIQFIHSHPQAIGQCREELQKLLGSNVKFLPTTSTSEAVKTLLSLDETHAAIGSAKAALHYGLEVLYPNLCNHTQNVTRFWVISAQQPPISIATTESFPQKTSLCVGLKQNRSGALLEVLSLFARHRLNLTKIESRPAKKMLGEYLFYLDVEGALSDQVNSELAEVTEFIRPLGIYPSLGALT